MELSVEKREKLGKGVKILRRQGLVPAEFYGHKVPNLHLAVKAKDFEKVFQEAGENTVINLLVDSESRPALIHDVQRDYLSNSVIHIDFYGVQMDEKIKAPVPVEFAGESPAVKEKGGILNKSLAEVDVEALPADLPHSFKVDVSSLNDLNQSIYVQDLKVPKGVKILLEPRTVLVTVMPPLAEEKTETPIEVSEVKVEAEEKAAERTAKKEKQDEAA